MATHYDMPLLLLDCTEIFVHKLTANWASDHPLHFHQASIDEDWQSLDAQHKFSIFLLGSTVPREHIKDVFHYLQAFGDKALVILDDSKDPVHQLKWIDLTTAETTFCFDEDNLHSLFQLQHFNQQLAQQQKELGDMKQELKRFANHEHYWMTHDPLTQLPNRRFFFEQLNKCTHHAEAKNHRFAVMIVGCDGFKGVNDGLGYQAGDTLICSVARRLKHRIRSTDQLARTGSDEFSILLNFTPTRKTAALIAQQLLNAVAKTFSLDNSEVSITASAGIALYPDDGITPEQLWRNAASALNQAKLSGCNSYKFYTCEMNSGAARQFQVASALHHALVEQQFLLHYQLQMNSETQRVVGIEALLRWVHPDLGHLSPQEFIPIAEKNGLILDIGGWVFLEACRQLRKWQLELAVDCTMAVNISARQVVAEDFIDRLTLLLELAQIDPKHIELEITENVFLAHPDIASSVLFKLKALGLRIALDDFGTGYSSLGYLKNIPIDSLKIDRSFIQDLEDNNSRKLVKAIAALAESMELMVVAEGVETENQVALLKELGCPVMQGFYFSRPLSGQECEKILRQYYKPVAKHRLPTPETG